eukprot:GHUV01024210.1.p2 GENE.GHUV01024210.1~~GHUV01024210.1.p2  ORF type:complete len:116 (-),score=18.10 GHUV01024210.1:625-972(-)
MKHMHLGCFTFLRMQQCSNSSSGSSVCMTVHSLFPTVVVPLVPGNCCCYCCTAGSQLSNFWPKHDTAPVLCQPLVPYLESWCPLNPYYIIAEVDRLITVKPRNYDLWCCGCQVVC